MIGEDAFEQKSSEKIKEKQHQFLILLQLFPMSTHREHANKPMTFSMKTNKLTGFYYVPCLIQYCT